MRSFHAKGNASSGTVHPDDGLNEPWAPEDPLLNRVYTLAEYEGRRRNLSHDEVMDVAMNALARCLEGHRFTPPSEEEVRHIAQNAARTARRSRSREHERQTDWTDLRDTDGNIGDATVDAQDPPYRALLKAQFLDAVRLALSPADADLFLQRVAEGATLMELASLHGILPGAMRMRLTRMVPQIRAALERQGWDETGSL